MQPHCCLVLFAQRKLLANYKCSEISQCKETSFIKATDRTFFKMPSLGIMAVPGQKHQGKENETVINA